MKNVFSRLSEAFSKAGGRFEVSPYDPETQVPMIRSSICTGEKVAGFRDKKSGRFSEVMLIRTDKDLEEFKRLYRVDHITTEY